MSQIEIYKTKDKQAHVEVVFDDETVWLTQKQITRLFDRDRTVITKHIRNIFKEGELKEKSVCANFAHTAKDGKTYEVQYYNLEVIISIGYRVKSRRGTQFRQGFYPELVEGSFCTGKRKYIKKKKNLC